MVPMWTRAWRFTNVYAYAAIDILFAILWFAAFISVETWEAEGIRKGAKGKAAKGGDDGACSHFAYGSESKCTTSKASVGFGVVIFLSFAVTSAISIHGVLKYKKTGIMPYGNPGRHGRVEQRGAEDPNKDAWSTNTDELDPNHPSNRHSDEEPDPRRAYGQIPAEEDEEGLLHRDSLHNPFQDTHSMAETQTEDGVHPGRPLSYQSSTNLSIAPPAYEEERRQEEVVSPSGYVAPSALSPSDYEETPGGRIDFPQGNYGADFR